MVCGGGYKKLLINLMLKPDVPFSVYFPTFWFRNSHSSITKNKQVIRLIQDDLSFILRYEKIKRA